MVTLSVITPVLNNKRYIQRCLDSVIQQNCASAEHLIIDGGSTDGTMDIVQGYAQEYAHIRWISEKDQGQSDALNKGIALAQGSILGNLNVDDCYEPGTLSRVLDLFEHLPEPGLLVGNCNVWNEYGHLVEVNRPCLIKYNDLLLGYTVNPIPINPSAYFYHKSIHALIGGYDVTEDYILDWDFLLRTVQVSHVHYFDEIWGNYYLIQGTKTFSDIENGNNRLRVAKLLKNHRSKLPPIQRAWIGLQAALLDNPVGSSLHYFFVHPDELPWRMKAWVIRNLGRQSWLSL
jgi:glycosyltransferase involved in cell wall biosynthesis